MTPVLFKNARVFAGHSEERPEGMSVLVENGLIREVSERPMKAIAGAHTVDVGNSTLIPGLIDAHIHAYASDVSVQKVDLAGEPYRTAHAARMLDHALDCGFTTVRDIGGGNFSLWRAIEDRVSRIHAGRDAETPSTGIAIPLWLLDVPTNFCGRQTRGTP
jgi:imidazolonepropionase-like amidohydrolase